MRQFLLHLFIILCNILNPKGIKAFLRSNVGEMPTMEYDAIYQFGDSLSDTGNVIRERSGHGLSYARLPYGRTFFHRATGRCSDGLLMVDYFAMFFHLPLLNPILARGSDFRYGANFAVAGATALDPTTLAAINVSSPVTLSSLSTQIHWFKSHLTSLCHNPSDCKRRLEKSLMLMGEIGGNDYNYAFFQGRTMREVYALVPQVVQAIKDAVQEIIKLGAMNIVVPGNFPIGCVPIYLDQFRTNDTSKYDELNCLKEYNEFSRLHNARLNEAIQDLQDQYPSVTIAYADYYSALKWVVANAPALGFGKDGWKKACCADDVACCTDPSKNVSWDGIHMTQAGNKYVAKWLLRHFVPVLQRRRPGQQRVHG